MNYCNYCDNSCCRTIPQNCISPTNISRFLCGNQRADNWMWNSLYCDYSQHPLKKRPRKPGCKYGHHKNYGQIAELSRCTSCKTNILKNVLLTRTDCCADNGWYRKPKVPFIKCPADPECEEYDENQRQLWEHANSQPVKDKHWPDWDWLNELDRLYNCIVSIPKEETNSKEETEGKEEKVPQKETKKHRKKKRLPLPKNLHHRRSTKVKPEMEPEIITTEYEVSKIVRYPTHKKNEIGRQSNINVAIFRKDTQQPLPPLHVAYSKKRLDSRTIERSRLKVDPRELKQLRKYALRQNLVEKDQEHKDVKPIFLKDEIHASISYARASNISNAETRRSTYSVFESRAPDYRYSINLKSKRTQDLDMQRSSYVPTVELGPQPSRVSTRKSEHDARPNRLSRVEQEAINVPPVEFPLQPSLDRQQKLEHKARRLNHDDVNTEKTLTSIVSQKSYHSQAPIQEAPSEVPPSSIQGDDVSGAESETPIQMRRLSEPLSQISPITSSIRRMLGVKPIKSTIRYHKKPTASHTSVYFPMLSKDSSKQQTSGSSVRQKMISRKMQ